MRYGIFSDIHSNLEALEAVLNAFQTEHIDAYLCVGDIVGYGADPNACIARIQALGAVTVAGNHDWASVGLIPTYDFNPEALAAVAWTKEKLDPLGRQYLASLPLVYTAKEFVLVHGSLDMPQNFKYLVNVYDTQASFQKLEAAVCFVGHTHVPVAFIRDPFGSVTYQDIGCLSLEPGRQYIVNTGSVGQPRDSVPKAAYCIFDTGSRTVEIKRVVYEVFTARRKIIEAGLPQFLGDRLLTGN